MKPTFTIHGEWPSFNEYINAERRNRFLAAKIKAEEMARIMRHMHMLTIEQKINITFQPYLKNRKKDPDSIMFHVKCFMDALVKKGILENDGQKQIGRITFEPPLIGEPRMDVFISYAEE